MVDIKFFDADGLDISKNTERKIENLFFREDFRRVYLDDIGNIDYAPNVIEPLHHRLPAAHRPGGRCASARSGWWWTTAMAASVEVLAPIFNAIQADVIALNATCDPDRYSRTAEEFDRTCRCWPDHGHAKADLGVRIDTGGETHLRGG